jgi:hypothetical protein
VPGEVTLLVNEYGLAEPQPVNVQTFADAGRYDGFELHAGDAQGILRGSRLDEVSSLSLKGIVFEPGELSSRAGGDELRMTAPDAQSAVELKPERPVVAKVTLKDGRSITLKTAVDTARPRAVLIFRSVQPSALVGSSNIQLADPGELPEDATVVFSIRTQMPAVFSHDETVDVATGDESFSSSLSLANGALALENSQVVVATFNPAKAFGPSAYGPLKFRVNAKGVGGDWQPLANLVRLPSLRALDCPQTPEVACKLSGANLYLIDSVSGDSGFAKPVVVPDGFLGAALPVPHPSAGTLYLKLRDNPQVINSAALTVRELSPASPEADRAEVRQSALRAEDAGSASTSPR